MTKHFEECWYARCYAQLDARLMSARAMAWAADCVLPPRHKLLLTWLAYHHNAVTGQCNPSAATLQRETSLSRSAFYRVMSDLVEGGIVMRSEGVFGKSRRTRKNYELHFAARVRDFQPTRRASPSGALQGLVQSPLNDRLVPPGETSQSPTSGTDSAQERQGTTSEQQEEPQRLLRVISAADDLEIQVAEPLASCLEGQPDCMSRLSEVLEAAIRTSPGLLSDQGAQIDAVVRRHYAPQRSVTSLVELVAYALECDQ